MQTHPSFVSIAFLGLFALPASAQTFVWEPYDPIVFSYASSPPLATATCAGDFDADGLIDAAALIDGHIAFVRAPGSWGAVISTEIAANDIAAGPYSNYAHSEAIAYVDAAGLKRYSVDATSGAVTIEPLALGGGWAGAVNLCAGSFGTTPLRVYSAITSDRHGVITRLEDGSTVTTYQFTTSLTLTAPRLFRYDTEPNPELALITDNGVEFRKLDGTMIRTIANAGPRGDVLCVMRGRGEPTGLDRIAWLRKVATAGAPGGFTQQVFVASRYSPVQTRAVLAPAWAYGMCSLDLYDSTVGAGADDDLDLAVVDKSATEPLVFENVSQNTSTSSWSSTPPAPLFTTADPERVDWINQPFGPVVPSPYPDSTLPATMPSVADFDGDGRPDLLLGSREYPLLEVVCSRPRPPVGEFTETETYVGHEAIKSITGTLDAGATAVVSVNVELALVGLDPDALGLDKLHILVWHEESGGGIASVGNYVWSLANVGATCYPDVDLTGGGTGGVSTSTNGLDVDDTTPEIFWLEIRAGKDATATGPALAGPNRILFLGNDCLEMMARKTGQTGFQGLLADGAIGSDTCSGFVDFIGGAWQTRPEHRVSGGTRRLLSPHGIPATTYPTPVAQQAKEFGSTPH